MKIVHSYWSLPNDSSDQDLYGRATGGFLDARFLYMSWALSCLSFKRFYDEIELVTDKKGKELLVDQLKLPYTKVTVCLDEFNEYHPKLWALGKIRAYQLQKEPFLHVDGDVYIWKKLGDKDFESAGLVVQNMELDNPRNEELMRGVVENFSYVSPEMLDNFYDKKNYLSVLAGVMGGSDIDFFQEYTKKAFDFVDRNIKHLDKINIGLFNLIYEQYLFRCMADEQNIPILPVLPIKSVEEYCNVMTLNLAPKICPFIHLIGFAKKNIYACEQIEMRLRYEFPEYYHAIDALFEKPYFNFSGQRFSQLKEAYDFMGSASMDDILNTEYILSPECRIVQSDELNYVEYVSPQTRQKEALPLANWNKLLEVFEEPTSGTEIFDFIKKDYAEDKLEALKFEVANFLTDKLIYTGILDIKR